MPAKGSSAAAFAAFALLLGLATLAVLATGHVDQGNRPSDQELTANGRTSVDLATMARLGTSVARFEMYRGLLRQISVEDLRYFPDSGKLVLALNSQDVRERPAKSYLYLPRAQPQSLAPYHGYTWRGPGVYILTGDR